MRKRGMRTKQAREVTEVRKGSDTSTQQERWMLTRLQGGVMPRDVRGRIILPSILKFIAYNTYQRIYNSYNSIEKTLFLQQGVQ